MKKKFLYIILAIVLFAFVTPVNADTGGYFIFDTEANNILKLGSEEVIEFNAAISTPGSYSYDLVLEYDPKVFELVDAIHGWDEYDYKECFGNVDKDYINKEPGKVTGVLSGTGGTCSDGPSLSIKYKFKLIAKESANATFTLTGGSDGVDGAKTQKKFTVRDDKNDNNVKSSIDYLASLDVSNVELSRPGVLAVTSGFEKYHYEYWATAKSDLTKITITATPLDPKATVTGTGTFDLKSGENQLKVICKAEDGSENEYSIKITRDYSSNENPLEVIARDSQGNKIDLQYDHNSHTYTGKVNKDGESIYLEIYGYQNNCELDPFEISSTSCPQSDSSPYCSCKYLGPIRVYENSEKNWHFNLKMNRWDDNPITYTLKIDLEKTEVKEVEPESKESSNNEPGNKVNIDYNNFILYCVSLLVLLTTASIYFINKGKNKDNNTNINNEEKSE